MKAVVQTEPGGAENLILKELEIPAPAEGEVLIKVHASAINPIDIKTRKGKGLYRILKEESTIVPGWDVSGEVVETGSNTSVYKKGDKVFGMIKFPGHGQAYAEYVTAPEKDLAAKPENITHQEAAGACLAALTAWQSLVTQAKIKEGDRVLIHAASGGVGHFAVQIAKGFGAYVAGTSSETNKEFLKECGIDEHIDYKQQEFDQVISDLDIVLDPVGGNTTNKSLTLLKPGGKLYSLVHGVTDELSSRFSEKNITAENYSVFSNGDDMKVLADWLKKGKLKTYVSKEYTPEQIQDAHRQIETGRTRGKLIVNFNHEGF